MKTLLTLLLFLIIGTGSISFSQTVTIGTQVWMTKNLDVTIFRNGDTISEAKTDEEWKKAGAAKQPAWCYYDNKKNKGKKYGVLYNWYAVSDPRGLAQNGYHIPSIDEWNILIDFLGGKDVAANKMKSTHGWSSDEGKIGHGSNSSRFAGLPGGKRDSYLFSFSDRKWGGYWWSSTEHKTSAWMIMLKSRTNKVDSKGNFKDDGLSVRCLRD